MIDAANEAFGPFRDFIARTSEQIGDLVDTGEALIDALGERNAEVALYRDGYEGYREAAETLATEFEAAVSERDEARRAFKKASRNYTYVSERYADLQRRFNAMANDYSLALSRVHQLEENKRRRDERTVDLTVDFLKDVSRIFRGDYDDFDFD